MGKRRQRKGRELRRPEAEGHDPGDRAQDNTDAFGQMVRWDISTGISGSLQAYAYGLRNPFRFSFDSLNGDLYIGDVGQGASARQTGLKRHQTVDAVITGIIDKVDAEES